MTSILIIDDDVSLCQIMGTVLSASGYTITTVHDGRAAVEAAGQRPYDVAVVDLFMPHMNGLEVITEFKAIRPDMGLILISGLLSDAATATKTADLAATLSGVIKLSKPFRRNELLDTVAQCVADSKAAVEKRAATRAA